MLPTNSQYNLLQCVIGAKLINQLDKQKSRNKDKD